MSQNNKLRVLLVATFPPPVHGSSMVSEQIKDSKLINEEFDVDWVNLGTSRSMAEIGKKSCSLYARKAFRFLCSYFKMLWKLLTHRYDLTYLAITCHDIGFLKDCPFVITARLLSKNYVIHQHNRGMAPYVHRAPYKWLLPMAYRNAKVILLSWRLYPDISEVVKKEQVLICPNGLAMPEYLLKHKDENLRLKEDTGIPEILFLSNLVEAKGVWPLLDALKMLKDKDIKFHCSFVGGTSRFISAEKFADEIAIHNLNDNIDSNDNRPYVEYLGPKYGDDKWKAYEKADIFVLPSMDDCLPLTVMEAMMTKTAVVGSDMGAIPDLVEAYSTDLGQTPTGFIISSEDLIVETGGKFLDWKPSAEMAAKIANSEKLKAENKDYKKGTNALAEALEKLLLNPGLCRQMGEAGYEKYRREFTDIAFEKQMLKCLRASIGVGG